MKKVLVIDDEPSITEIIGLYADKLGYDCDRANSGDEALALFQRQRYWAIFCDYHMPGLGGLDVHAELCSMNSGRSLNFVLLTGTVLDDRVKTMTDQKNILVFHKPFDFDDIRSTFSQLESRRENN